MANTTAISWTDSTYNPWWGCTKIAPGCDNCYAAALDKRTGGNYWDAKQKPRKTKLANIKKVLSWNKQASIENRRRKVFCGSMMDWCDKDAPEGAADELFDLIKQTPMLDWQLLTKRATLIEDRLPKDWGEGYPNVWLGVTAEDRDYGYPRIEAFRRTPAKVRFVSAEPLLEDLSDIDLSGMHWLIIGGESGPGCRPMDWRWANNLVLTAENQSVPVWFKQMGGRGKDKGGDKINGVTIKQWPRFV